MSRVERTLESNEWKLEEEVNEEKQCKVGKRVIKGQEVKRREEKRRGEKRRE